MPSITIQNATLTYAKTPIFLNINMHIPAGQWVGLLGPSGIGKTSLLRLLAGFTTPHEQTSASITVDNGIPLHQQIAYMGQTDLLLPWLTALQNVTLNYRLDPHCRSNHAEKAAVLLKQVGLEHALHHYPHQLSGGMRQRVALARTLIQDKPIVLMDEPFSALDAITRYQLQALTAELLRDKTVLFITHDPQEALRLANDIYIMQGKPALLKHVVNLTSPTPRELNNADLIQWQEQLLRELSQLQGAA